MKRLYRFFLALASAVCIVSLEAAAFDDAAELPGGSSLECYTVTSTSGGRVYIEADIATYGMSPGGDAVVQIFLGCQTATNKKAQHLTANPSERLNPGFSTHLSAGESIIIAVYKGNHLTIGFNTGAVHVTGGGARIRRN